MKKATTKKTAIKNGKRIIRKYRFYPSFLLFLLDRWLKKMSLKGWHLIENGSFSFTFEEGQPCEKEYFSCLPSGENLNGGGKYSIHLRHPFFERVYGVHKKRSKLNKATSRSHVPLTIIEVDKDRIDINTNIGYLELKHDRNRLLAIDYLRAILIISVPLLIGHIIWFWMR